jgi:hypothetical protein
MIRELFRVLLPAAIRDCGAMAMEGEDTEQRDRRRQYCNGGIAHS